MARGVNLNSTLVYRHKVKKGPRNFDKAFVKLGGPPLYEVWNFNSGNYLFTTDTK